MYGCEILFDAETAALVCREVSEKLGGACPCVQGLTCPLLPADVGAMLTPAEPGVPLSA